MKMTCGFLLLSIISSIFLCYLPQQCHSGALFNSRSRSFSFSKSNSNAGDAMHVRNRHVRQHDRHNTSYACEGETMNISCPKGYWIRIIRANYGRFSLNICNDKEMPWADTQCKNKDSSRIMEERCNGLQKCHVRAHDDTFEDKCPETHKYLEAIFECRTHTTTKATTTTTSTTTSSSTSATTMPKFNPEPFKTQRPNENLVDNSRTTPSAIVAVVASTHLQFCPAVFLRGIEWPTTQIHLNTFVQCPNNPRNKAFWLCGADGQWVGTPDLGHCISDWIEDLRRSVVTITNADDSIQLTKNIRDNTRIKDELYGGDAFALTEVVKVLVDNFNKQLSYERRENKLNYIKNFSEAVLQVAGELLQDRRVETWEDLDPDTQIRCADRLIQSVEASGFMLANISTKTEILQSASVVLDVGHVQIQEYVKFPTESLTNFKLDSVQIPKAALEQASSSQNWVKVIFASFDGIGRYMKPYKEKDVERKVVSKVLMASLGVDVNHLSSPVIVTFATEKNENMSNAQCVFWNSGENNWSSEGCRVQLHNATHTVCACDHLTSFAVLMDVHGVRITSAHYLALSLITYIGCIISIVALTLSIAAFCLLKGVHGDRATIHKNLCFCLLVAELVFLFGIAQVEYKIGCTIIAAVLHYFFLAAFAWMLLEGFQLYALLVEVFEAEQSRKKYFYLFAYGMPAVIVGISLGVDHTSYGTKRHCWLNTDNYFVFSFVGPVIVVLLANLLFLFMALVVMCRHRGSWSASYKHSPTKTTVENFGAWLKATTVLVFLLGLTWAFGLFYISQETQIVAYIFTVLNSLQGVFIFLFHVVFNEKMRKEWNKFVRRNDWVPSWVRDPAVASDPIMCGLNPCVPLNSSSGGVRSGGTSPVNTDSTNSGNNSYLQKLFRPLLSTKRDSNRPLLGRSSSSTSGNSGKYMYDVYARQQRVMNLSSLNSPRYINDMRQVPKFPPPSPPRCSYDDEEDVDMSKYDCSVIDSQYVDDFCGDALIYVPRRNDACCCQLSQKTSPIRSDLDSGYSGSESCARVHQKQLQFEALARKISNKECQTTPRRSSLGSGRINEHPVSFLQSSDTLCCKSSPSLQKPDCSCKSKADCEKMTQTEDLVDSAPLMNSPDFNYEIPSRGIVALCDKNGRTNTVLASVATIAVAPSKLPQRVRSCNK